MYKHFMYTYFYGLYKIFVNEYDKGNYFCKNICAKCQWKKAKNYKSKYEHNIIMYTYFYVL